MKTIRVIKKLKSWWNQMLWTSKRQIQIQALVHYVIPSLALLKRHIRIICDLIMNVLIMLLHITWLNVDNRSHHPQFLSLLSCDRSDSMSTSVISCLFLATKFYIYLVRDKKIILHLFIKDLDKILKIIYPIMRKFMHPNVIHSVLF